MRFKKCDPGVGDPVELMLIARSGVPFRRPLTKLRILHVLFLGFIVFALIFEALR